MGHPGHPRGDLALSGLLAAYRRTGAEPPFGDPRRAHGVGMEGHYWRFTEPGGAWSVAVICAVCRAADGMWAMVTLAAEPGGFARTRIAAVASASTVGLGLEAGALLRAGADAVHVDLGPDARLEARLENRRDWPRRAWGAMGPAQVVPALGQYWAPHLLAARVSGSAQLGSRALDLAGASAYAEKNWGARFAGHWWWGQAPLADGAGVAFAGGRLPLPGATAAPTAIAAWTPDGLVSLAPPLARTTAAAAAGAWRVRATSARWLIELEGRAGDPPLRLPVPLPALRATTDRSEHHLRARLSVTVRRGRRTWLQGESTAAALEEGRP